MAACDPTKFKTPNEVMDKIEAFKQKEKFLEDSIIYYPGIADPLMRPILSQKMNLAADDFKKLLEGGIATDKDYQDKIQEGLHRFSDIYLDTEDRERVCRYFEELMDIVGLQSSGGHINEFMYGFDPKKNNKNAH